MLADLHYHSTIFESRQKEIAGSGISRRDFLTLRVEPTHVHKKGGRYEFSCYATATDRIEPGEKVAFYSHSSGEVYARPARLFDEHERFEPI